MFIFKLIGAPDCLIEFDEFTFKIQRRLTELQDSQSSLFNTGNTTTVLGAGRQFDLMSIKSAPGQYILTGQTNVDSSKINENGYINFDNN